MRKKLEQGGYKEVNTPQLVDSSLWKDSGHWDKFREQMFVSESEEKILAIKPMDCPCHVQIFRQGIKSYKELPLNIYQIQTKFRDEVRPRYGVMRGREFLMKDSYSFNINQSSLDESYQLMRETYKKIIDRLGLKYKIVKADSGAIGGDVSEEFHVLAENGEDTIAVSDSSEFAINTELLLKDGEDLQSLQGKPSPDGKGVIEIKKGIEVGHIFQLGEVYTNLMNANVLDKEGYF